MNALPLGNLHPFVSAIAAHALPSLSYEHTTVGLAEWRVTARMRALDLLRYAPPPAALASEVLERVDCGDYLREKMKS